MSGEDWKQATVRKQQVIQLVGNNRGWVDGYVCPNCRQTDNIHDGTALHRAASGWVCVCGEPYQGQAEVRTPGDDGLITVSAHINGAVKTNPFLTPTEIRYGKTVKEQQAPDEAWVDAGFTDLGNSKRLVIEHGEKFRYVSDRRGFLVYDGFRWVEDKTCALHRFAKHVVELMHVAAQEIGINNDTGKQLAKHAISSSSKGRIEAMIELAKSDAYISLHPDQLDAIPHILNCQNGAVELTTGLLQTHDPLDYTTKLVPVAYDPDAECPLWDDFIQNTVAAGDTDLAEWIQKAVGYTLTGDMTEQCFFFLYGEGANGKSLFLDVISSILDDYSTAASFDLFLRGSRDNVEHGLAALEGVRLATAIEAPAGRSWNESLLKTITGGDRVRVSRKYQNGYEVQLHSKLWFAANTRPVIQGRDIGIWRRFVPIPCRAHIPKEEQDRGLRRKLLEEAPGILAWAVRGAVRWHDEGGLLPFPEVIEDAVKDYKDSSDTFGRFFAEVCQEDPDAMTPAGEILKAYNHWAKESGERSLNHNTLSEILRNFRAGKFTQKPDAQNRRCWVGIRVIPIKESEQEGFF